jgi:hypothetical protein
MNIMRCHRLGCSVAVVMLLAIRPMGAQVPAPVDLGILNLPQETQVWCWAAVAQQIIHARVGPGRTPAQCALVALANGAAPGFCCSGYNPMCVRTGSLPQIAALIREFGGRASTYAPPTDPMTLYRTLAAGRPVILHVRSSFTTSHVVVLRGMTFVQTPFGVEAVLHINDPLAYFTQPVPFSRLAPLWVEALVVN